MLTDLDGQQFWQLCDAGSARSGWSPRRASTTRPRACRRCRRSAACFGTAWRNQELTDYTAGLYAARHRAMHDLTAQARKHGADGVVGVSFSQHVRAVRVQRSMGIESEDMIVTLHVIGTAIREDPALAGAATPPAPPPSRSLRAPGGPPDALPTRLQ